MCVMSLTRVDLHNQNQVHSCTLLTLTVLLHFFRWRLLRFMLLVNWTKWLWAAAVSRPPAQTHSTQHSWRCVVQYQPGSEVTCVGSVLLTMCFKYKQDCLNERLNAKLISAAGGCTRRVRDRIVGVNAEVSQHIPASLLRWSVTSSVPK